MNPTDQSPLKLPRRQALGLGLASVGALLSGCESLEQRLTRTELPEDALPPRVPAAHSGLASGGAGLIPPSPAVRILNRVAFGPRPGDIAHVEKVGIAGYVDEQLDPDSIDEEAAATWRVHRLGDSLSTDTGLLFDQDDHRLVGALREAALLRAVYSRRQLHERMVEFWGDHFNIYAFKGQGPQLKIVDDQNTIRTHALGKFRDLLGASAQSAAMLGYLDNTVNRRGVPNENYARELMELHTLGVDGGYTQRDVKEVARCLTGWTADRHWHRGRFGFDAGAHDTGAKRVLGVNIPAGGGVEDGEKVLDIVSRHRSTARHLSRKLCIAFLGEASPDWVSRLSAVFLKTGGDIKAVLRPLLTSPDLLSARPILKRPFDYMTSALRALNVDTDGGAPLQQFLEKMGQPLFAWPMPDGYPRRASAWTGTLIPRWNFALALAGRRIANTSPDGEGIKQLAKKNGMTPHDTLIELVFGCSAADPAVARLRSRQQAHPDPSEFAALLLMSPEFQWR